MMRFRWPADSSRRAFTLIELLVVIAIIGVLVALLLPAVQKVRETAGRMRCENNLKQLAIACQTYHDIHEVLPPGGRLMNQNGFADKGSWLVYTLPFMEQQSLFSKIPDLFYYNPTTPYDASTIPIGVWDPLNNSITAAFPTLPAKLPYGRCPSDDYDAQAPVSNYVGSMGPGCALGPCGYDPFQQFCNRPGWGYTASPDYGDTYTSDGVRGLFNRLGAPITLTSITDGTSNTLLIGETLAGEHGQIRTFNNWAKRDGGQSHCTTIIPINYKSDQTGFCSPADRSMSNQNISWGFKSRHAGGANFAFADGSVHFVRQDIDHRTYQLLGCRNDDQPAELP